ncbi:hypothetical protein [Schnuerera ultunensis]|nr:hypothetical protein [Schnuerera ultunensis]
MDNTIIDVRYGLIKFMSLFHRLFTPTFKKENGRYIWLHKKPDKSNNDSW